MPELLLGILIMLPILLGVAATALVWARISHRVLYCVVCILALLGLQSLFAPAAMLLFLPFGKGLSAAVANDAFPRGVLVGATIQLTLGVGILWWLYRVLRSP